MNWEVKNTIELMKLLNNQNQTHDLIKNITGFIKKWTNCEAVGVRLKEGDDYPYFETRGFPQKFLEVENSICIKDPQGRIVRDSKGYPIHECMCGNIINGRFDSSLPFFTEKGSFWTNCTTELLATTTEKDRQARTRNRCNGEGYESVALIPLKAGNEILGLLQINDHEKNRFTPEIIFHMENIADQIALALSQRTAQAALKESEELYRSLFENMLNGFAYCKMIFENGQPVDFICLAVNDAFEKQTGLKNVIGKKVTEVIPGLRETEPGIFEIYGRVALTGIPEKLEIYLDTLKMWLSISLYSHKKEYFVAVFDVITERKNSEFFLRESEKRFRSVIESSPDAIFIQTEGCFSYVNPAALRLFGADSEAQLIGTPIVDRFHPDYREQVLDRIRQLNHYRQSVPMAEEVCIGLDGSQIFTEVSAVPFTFNQENGALVFARDITEKLKLQKEKEKLQAQYLHSQKMESVGRLAGGVAHDFNNILGVVMGYLELSFEYITSDHPIYTNLMTVHKAAIRAAEITQQLLTFARKQTIEPRIINLNYTVEKMLRILSRLIGEDIELTWMPAKNIWNINIDPAQIDQILANLAVNARDAITGVGKVVIETENVVFDDNAKYLDLIPGEYVMLSVSDNGCGIEKDVIEHIFDPFFTTKEAGKGTGLGLATIYGIVKQNNSFIKVYSEPDMGSTFKIYFPRCKGHIVEKEDLDLKPVVKGKETILIVEDDKVFLEFSKLMIEGLGYKVFVANTVMEAIRIAEEYDEKIDLLITDVVMPEMNGRELVVKICSIRPDIKNIFMSGYTADIIAHRGVLGEGIHFIQKPFSVSTMANKIRQVLDG